MQHVRARSDWKGSAFLHALASLVALAACAGPAPAIDPRCQLVAPTSCPAPSPRYADVAPIIAQRCAGPCHSGIPDGPWPLTTYEHVADWAEVVRDEVLTCRMPPVDAGIDMPLPERLALLTWVRCGFPE